MNVSLSTTQERTDITYGVHSNRHGRPYATLSVEQGPDVVMLHCDRSTVYDHLAKKHFQLAEDGRILTRSVAEYMTNRPKKG